MQAHEMCVAGEVVDALKMLNGALNATRTRDFDEIMLAAIELVETIDCEILISLLCHTISFKERILLRDWLFAAVMARYVLDPSRTHRVQRLLGGLEGTDVNPWTTDDDQTT